MTIFIYNWSTRTLPCHSSMEHWPNPGPEKGKNYFKQQSPDIGPDEQSFPLTEYITIHNATKFWEGPRYPAYNSRAARLRSYTEWPHGLNPSPSSLSTAGFYFIGKRLNYFLHLYNVLVLHRHINPRLFDFQVTAIWLAVFTAGVLGECRTTDDEFIEHARWYPNCVFVRYIKGEEFIRDCQKSCKACTLMLIKTFTYLVRNAAEKLFKKIQKTLKHRPFGVWVIAHFWL